jgi:O-succinylbenzoic acid--CoA ligase
MSAPFPSATLGDALRRAARLSPDTPALLGDFGQLTWAELATRAAHVAAGLARGRRPRARRSRGAARGGAAARPRRPRRACWPTRGAGIPLLPLHPALPEADAARLAAAAHARRLTVAQCLERATTAAQPPPVRADDDLLLVPTSGSSGEPKLARLTHRAVLAAAVALTERLPFGPADRWILTLPLSHVGGLSVVSPLHRRRPAHRAGAAL